MTDLEAWEYLDKMVRVRLKNGRIFTGVVEEYTPHYDNTGEVFNGKTSICVGPREMAVDEIDYIELI